MASAISRSEPNRRPNRDFWAEMMKDVINANVGGMGKNFAQGVHFRAEVVVAVKTGHITPEEHSHVIPCPPDPAATPAEPAADAVPPGVIIDRSPEPARVYIGSPSIAVLPGGEYLASHDFFGPGTTNSQTAVFASNDRGKTWRKTALLDGQWWSTLFVHRGNAYIIGTSKEYGTVVIRRSNDAGRT
jgi:hypothetical protein